MSLIDKYAEYMSAQNNPNRRMTLKYLDPNYLTPDVFYMMDEVGKRQVLRKFDKSSGQTVYVGTYQIIYKTEDMNRFCLVMRRIGDERPVPREYYEESQEEMGTFIVAEYYPGTHCRIYLKGLNEAAVNRVVAKFEKKYRKKLPMSNGDRNE